MMVAAGCSSQGCHVCLPGSIAAPFAFTRYLSHTHLLSEGLILINFFAQAMAEEKKRYCLVLDRTSIVAKSTMEFCEHVSFSCLKCGGMQSVLPH